MGHHCGFEGSDFERGAESVLGAIRGQLLTAIANALLAEGMDEGKTIRIAIAKAQDWARHHGLALRDDED